MMNLLFRIWIFFILFLFAVQSFGQLKPKYSHIHLIHSSMTVGFDTTKKLTDYSYQTIRKIGLSHIAVDRYSNFILDPTYKKCPSPTNYTGSSYDKGHLCNALDNRYSEKAEKESFYLTNCVPQNPNFNRGIWNELESDIRDTCMKYDSVFVCSGTICLDKRKMGKDSISVPTHMWKYIYIHKKKKYYFWLFLNKAYMREEEPTTYICKQKDIQKLLPKFKLK